MNRPRSRRTLLASVATTVAVATGGFEHVSNATNTPPLEGGTVPPDWYDCRSVTRPAQTAPGGDEALEPRPYPSPPWTADSGEDGARSDRSPPSLIDSVARYVTEFERAYRRNAFLARYGSAARTFELRRQGKRTAAIGSSGNATAAMVAIRYDLTTGTRQTVTDPRDEWDIRVTYYVDENVMLRARYDGIAEELAFEPDPRTQGSLVACFD